MCLSTKFKPRQHWKVITKNILGEEIKVIPVWKVLYQNRYSKAYSSPLMEGSWEPGCWNISNYSSTYTYNLVDINNNVMTRGYHCYYRKSDALKALLLFKTDDVRDDAVLIKMYASKEDILGKGYSIYSNYLRSFVVGNSINQFSSIEEALAFRDGLSSRDGYRIFPTLVAKKLFFPEQLEQSIEIEG